MLAYGIFLALKDYSKGNPQEKEGRAIQLPLKARSIYKIQEI